MPEFRLYGPPGTGKTSTLIRWIGRGVELHGEAGVFVASYTKAAALHIGAKVREAGLHLAKGLCETLHAHCYRMLGRPKLAEAHIKEWNEAHPDLALGSDTPDPDDPLASEMPSSMGQSPTAKAAFELQILRARAKPEETWPLGVRAFASKWTAWKREAGYLDFTDLLEVCLRDVDRIDGAPGAAYIDEAQDLKPLELALIRRWCAGMDQYVLAGDDDQVLYDWCGASPDVLLDRPFDPARDRVLDQSFRVSAAVHRVAQNIVGEISHRQAKIYRPTPEPGEVLKTGATWKNPRPLLPIIEREVSEGRSVMLLAACSYMLAPSLALLKAEAFPFSNRYRPKRGDWNPLARGAKGRMMPVDRLEAFLSTDPEFRRDAYPDWRWRDLLAWTDPLWADQVFLHGGRKTVEHEGKDKTNADLIPDPWDLDCVMLPAAQDKARAHDLAWLHAATNPKGGAAFRYAIEMARRRGKQVIRQEPLLTVGTIHSVKGAEADTVILFPDVSPSGAQQLARWGTEEADSVHRVFYVGVTRARTRLILCSPLSRMSYPLARAAA